MIGEGGFGTVFTARHRVDGNIYAIKKIKLANKPNSDENRRIRREVQFLSELNNQYIVRYFQTWIEVETDPEKIAEFGSSESDSQSSEDMLISAVRKPLVELKSSQDLIEEEDWEYNEEYYDEEEEAKPVEKPLPFAALQHPGSDPQSPARKRARTD